MKFVVILIATNVMVLPMTIVMEAGLRGYLLGGWLFHSLTNPARMARMAAWVRSATSSFEKIVLT